MAHYSFSISVRAAIWTRSFRKIDWLWGKLFPAWLEHLEKMLFIMKQFIPKAFACLGKPTILLQKMLNIQFRRYWVSSIEGCFDGELIWLKPKGSSIKAKVVLIEELMIIKLQFCKHTNNNNKSSCVVYWLNNNKNLRLNASFYPLPSYIFLNRFDKY